MKEVINFGIGFLAGRPNVCKIINYYYKQLIEQLQETGKDVKITIFIMYDLEYLYCERLEFYNLKPEVYKQIEIKYITPEDIEEEKKILQSRFGYRKSDINLFLGKGYAKARNSILYFALKRKVDYLYFWDDDEYPVANIKGENNTIIWKEQKDLLVHFKSIENADVTFGYRCGIMTPIPYIEYNEHIKEEDVKNYIDAISNEAVSWEKVKSIMKADNGMTYADEKIMNFPEVKQLENLGTQSWVLASGLCLNLRHIDKIPAFYNPPEARGEDTFFSIGLKEAKVLQVPTYHFHDGFLKYTNIIAKKYPKKLNKIAYEGDMSIEERFLKASKGWIKYKPLLLYLTEQKNYRNRINETIEKLKLGIPIMNQIFNSYEFEDLLEELQKYDQNVKKDYREYLRTNEIWKQIKLDMK